MSDNPISSATILRSERDFQVVELDDGAWQQARRVEINTYWSGRAVPDERQFSVSLLWTQQYLYARFEAKQEEPLVVSEKANLGTKTLGLWDRDVCEIFIAPDRNEPRKYFEFEIAPNGEWIDLEIDITSGERLTDWDYKSNMESAVRVEKDKIVMAIKVPWTAFGKTPKMGAVWLGNLFRCVGTDPGRGYLAWQPTMTAEPAFHVPEKFGEFRFVK